MTTFLPVSRCHCPAASSSALFKLAAANTTTSLPCATAGKVPAAHANPAPTRRASQERLVVIAASVRAISGEAYRGPNIAGFSAGSIVSATIMEALAAVTLLFRRDCTLLRHPCQRRDEGREARGSQRVIRFLQLAAQPLDGRGGIVADAVDREEQVVGPADEAGQKCRAVLDAAIVVQEAGARSFNQRLELRNLMHACAHVEDGTAEELGRSLVVGGRWLEQADEVVLDRYDLAGKRVALGHRPLQRGFHLLQGCGCRAEALLDALVPRDLLPKLPVELRDHTSERLDFAAGRVVLGLAAERMPGLMDEHLVESSYRLVARRKSVAQFLLLPVELLDQRAVVLLQLPQPGNVGAIGGADEMRQHVHVSERLLHDRVGRDRMAQHSPIGARDVAALDRLRPHPAQRLFVLGPRELLD